jgi:hypothetical protein
VSRVQPFVHHFAWPSTFYAIDIVAWDVFFGLALLFADPMVQEPPIEPLAGEP